MQESIKNQSTKKKLSREEYCKILDDANAVKLYTEDEWSQTKIGNKYGVSSSSVGVYLKHIKGINSLKAKGGKGSRSVIPIGTKYGLWTIIDDKQKKGRDRQIYQLCRCVCGDIQWKAINHLECGRSTRCKKCANKTYISNNGEIKVNALILSFFNHIRGEIKSRKKVKDLEFNITPEYLEELYELQNRKCAISGLPLNLDIKKTSTKQNWSLDRIDSNIGYVKGNVQWVHKDINMMKQSYSNNYFIDMCKKVSEYNQCLK